MVYGLFLCHINIVHTGRAQWACNAVGERVREVVGRRNVDLTKTAWTQPRRNSSTIWCWYLYEVPTLRNSYWNKFAVDKLWSFNLGQWRKATVEMLNSGVFQCLITCLRETRAGWNCGRSRKDSFYFCLTAGNWQYVGTFVRHMLRSPLAE